MVQPLFDKEDECILQLPPSEENHEPDAEKSLSLDGSMIFSGPTDQVHHNLQSSEQKCLTRQPALLDLLVLQDSMQDSFEIPSPLLNSFLGDNKKFQQQPVQIG